MFFELFPLTSTFLLQLAVFGIFSGLSFLILAALLPQISRIIAPRLQRVLHSRKREQGHVTIFASHGELNPESAQDLSERAEAVALELYPGRVHTAVDRAWSTLESLSARGEGLS